MPIPKFLNCKEINDICYKNLYLDPKNPRLALRLDTRSKKYSFEEIKAMQKELIDRINDNEVSFKKLRISLETNGYIGAERIIIQEIEGIKGKFLVKEGNRRIAVIKTIMSDKELLKEIPKEIIESLKYPPCYLLPPDISDIEIYQMLNARHVVGTKPWGLAERGIAVADLYKLLIKQYPEGKNEKEQTILQILAKKAGISSVQAVSNFLIAVFLQNEVEKMAAQLLESKDFQRQYIKMEELKKMQLDLYIEAARNGNFTKWIGLERNKQNYLESDIQNKENFRKYVDYILSEIITSARNHQRFFFRILREEEEIVEKLINRIEKYRKLDIKTKNIPKIVYEEYESSKPDKSIITIQSFTQFIKDLSSPAIKQNPNLKKELSELINLIEAKLEGL